MADTVYTPFASDDIVPANPSRITNALWSNGVGILETFYTSSEVEDPPILNDRYYIDIYAGDPTTEQVEFSVAYGHVSGSGAPSTDLDYPTKAIYTQYKNLLLNNPTGQFTYVSAGTTVSMSQFYAISIKRANIKQRLDVGNWELHLSWPASSSALSLIDESGDSLDTSAGNVLRSYAVISGSISGGQVGTKSYGLVYPDYGVILLNAETLGTDLTMSINSGSTSYVGISGRSNLHQFFMALTGSEYFAARSEEQISSTHYFVRVKNQQYNYSTNPTFYSASDGTIIQSGFYNDPQVFLTTVGLYNDSNELLAVAKLSQPVTKAFDKEALVKVRLDF